MNASEDQTEPLGEAPEVPRSPVGALLEAAAVAGMVSTLAQVSYLNVGEAAYFTGAAIGAYWNADGTRKEES